MQGGRDRQGRRGRCGERCSLPVTLRSDISRQAGVQQSQVQARQGRGGRKEKYLMCVYHMTTMYYLY